MLEAFRKFVSDFAEGGKPPSRFGAGDYRLAVAALLVHAAGIDGLVSDVERTKLRDLIRQRFELEPAAADELIAKATEAEHEAIDLYHFTSLLNRSLDEAGRRRIVEMMWEIIYADGRVSEFDSNLVWRAADLLGVSSRERIELGHEVASRMRSEPT